MTLPKTLKLMMEPRFLGTSILEWSLSFLALIFSVWLISSQVDVTIHDWAMIVFPQGFWQELWAYLSRAGQIWFQILVCIALGIFYYHRGRYNFSRVWYLSIPIFIIVGALNYPLKVIFGRPRPKLYETMYDFQWFEIPSNLHGFPSGHTVTTFCLLATVVSLYRLPVKVMLFLIASVLGFARVGIGSHYMADVVAGAVVGYLGGRMLKQRFIDKK